MRRTPFLKAYLWKNIYPFSTLTRIFLFATSLSLGLSACQDQAKQAPSAETTPSETSGTEPTTTPVKKEEKIILFFGNSLTAGYGLEDEAHSFPSRIQEKIDSAGLDYTVVNAGLSGETTAGGLGRIDWVLKQDIDIFVLELGGNDVLRGLDLDATRENLRGILEKVKAKDPAIKLVLTGMLAPPNMGEKYTRAFAKIYPDLAKEYHAVLVPFLLEGVGGVDAFNQQDGIHPNEAGARLVADNVWEELEKIL